MNKSDWFSKVHENTSSLKRLADKIGMMSDYFAMTGNKEHANYLMEVAEIVSLRADNIESAVAKYVNDEFNASQKALGDTLAAILDATTKQLKE